MIQLNRKSWHFWLASKFGDYCYSEPEYQNVCTYTRCFLKGLIVFIISTILTVFMGAIFLGLPLFALGWLIGYMFGFFSLFDPKSRLADTVFSGFLLSLMWIVFGIIFGIVKFWKNGKKFAAVKQPSFLKVAYRSWKDKYCIKVEFK
jgi:hypothetical protein